MRWTPHWLPPQSRDIFLAAPGVRRYSKRRLPYAQWWTPAGPTPYGSTSTRKICRRKSRIYTGGTVDTSAIVTAVQITAHSYSLTGSGNDTVELDGKTYHHTTEVLTITNPNATASDKQNVIEVNQATLVHPSNAAAVAQHIYSYYTKRQTQKIRIVTQGERPGDHVAAPTPWGTMVDGFISSMRVVLSGIAAADCEIVGVDVRAVGGSEEIMANEVYSGEL